MSLLSNKQLSSASVSVPFWLKILFLTQRLVWLVKPSRCVCWMWQMCAGTETGICSLQSRPMTTGCDMPKRCWLKLKKDVTLLNKYENEPQERFSWLSGLRMSCSAGQWVILITDWETDVFRGGWGSYRDAQIELAFLNVLDMCLTALLCKWVQTSSCYLTPC